MQSTFGSKIKYSLFGESHGIGVGITVHGLGAGIYIDMLKINKHMQRRSPGKFLSTKRQENDEIRFLSGLKNGYTTGAPLTIFIENKDFKPSDYSEFIIKPRPSHADFTHLAKFGEYADLSGSGHLSARLTAPIVAISSIIKEMKVFDNIIISSHIERIGDILDGEINDYSLLEKMNLKESERVKDFDIAMLEDKSRDNARSLLRDLRCKNDSVGGKIKVSIKGIEAGLGRPFFESFESVISSLCFSIPGVKAIEFGAGVEFAYKNGSSANDEFVFDENTNSNCDSDTNFEFLDSSKIFTKTNNSGGLNGGISNGMPINFALTFRPTSSIGIVQNTVNLKTNQNSKIEIKGRHDPCIVLRAMAVAEAMSIIALAEFLL